MNNQTTFRNILAQNCNYYGDITAFSYQNKSGKITVKSFNELQSDVISFSNYLSNVSSSENRIGVIMQNCYEYMLTCFSCVCGAGVFIPLDSNWSSEQIMNNIYLLEINIVIFDFSSVEKITNICKLTPQVQKYISLEPCSENELSFIAEPFPNTIYDNVFRFDDSDPDSTHIIITSSGTSSNYQKHVRLSANNLLKSMICFNEELIFENRLHTLLALPFGHIFAIYAMLNFVLISGHEMFLSKGMQYIEDDLLTQNPDFVFLVPSVAQALLNKFNLEKARNSHIEKEAIFGTKLNYLILSGAKISDQIIYDYYKLDINVLRIYGSTEATGPISYALPITSLNDDCKTVGTPFKCFETKIENDELFLKGPSVMLGYYGNDEKENNCFVDGWFKTGDQGYLTEEGNLYINGRISSMIPLSSGKNVVPEELEDFFSKIDGVNECIVFSPNFTDLYLMVYSEYEPYKFDEIKSILKEVNFELQLYQQVRHIIISDIPFIKTSSGKIKRENLFNHYNYITLLDKIRKIIDKRLYPNSIIRFNTNFREELGISSYELVAFIGEIEKEMKQVIPKKYFLKMNSLSHICDYIYNSDT
jgi:long-chain acyl-CoA synthetase